MRRNNEFFLKRIADKTYILPVGQMVADHYKSVLVNSVGEYIWNLLDDDISVSEIKQKCINFFPKGNKMSRFSSAIPFHKKGKHLQFLKPEIDNWLKADNHTNK